MNLKFIIKENKILKENLLDPNEFPKEKGWQRNISHSAADDLFYPQGDGWVEVLENKINFNFAHPFNLSIGVINMVPIKQATKDKRGDEIPATYEEFINETVPDPLLGLEEMKRHIAPGRTINFGFTAFKKGRNVNILIISVDGDDPRMFIRSLT